MATARRRTKAELLRDLRGLESGDEEAALLADVPYVLQGVSSRSVKFPDAADRQMHSVTLVGDAPPPGMLHLLAQAVECGLLCRKIGLHARSDDQKAGLVMQSFRAAVVEELTTYLTKVSVIENEIRDQVEDGVVALGPQQTPRVTLKRVLVWVKDDVLRLRLMNTLIDQIGAEKGGAAINVVHRLSRHGDPLIQSFTSRILKEMSRPFYQMLARWVYDGELVDPYGEFLVQVSNPATGRGRTHRAPSTEEAWQGKYIMVDGLVPVWISSALAQKIFLIGKSLNFIRHSCNDDEFVTAHARESARVLTSDDLAELERTIDTAYLKTSRHLKQLLFDKFHLPDHLLALKKYILLNSGDFCNILMEALGDSLQRAAHTLHGHNLTSALSDAIQTSNAHHEPEHVLKRLDARMLEGTRGTIGWDVFTLEYRVGRPLDVVVTEANARQYLKLFNFLWRLKRVGHDLDQAWRRHATAERGMINQVPRAARAWKLVRGLAAEMIHFVCQLQYYILFEVVESSWAGLQKALARPDAGLDDLIAAHDGYVRSVLDKTLLSGNVGASNNTGSRARDEKAASAAAQHRSKARDEENLATLHEILKCILTFVGQQDQLYKYTLTMYQRQQVAGGSSGAGGSTKTTSTRQAVNAKRNARKYDVTRDDTTTLGSQTPTSSTPTTGSNGGGNGGGSGSGGGSGEEADDALRHILQQVERSSAVFRKEVVYLLAALYASPSQEMKMLAVRLNFNDHYQIPRWRHSASSTSAAATSNAGTAAHANANTASAATNGVAHQGTDGGGGGGSGSAGSSSVA